VSVLVVLYSINVFITFSLSLLGSVQALVGPVATMKITLESAAAAGAARILQ
jgi:hypothetical protein